MKEIRFKDSILTFENRTYGDFIKEIEEAARKEGIIEGEALGIKSSTEWSEKLWIPKALQEYREKLEKEISGILENEINLAHTTKSGKTSRLTSAYMRIRKILKKHSEK